MTTATSSQLNGTSGNDTFRPNSGNYTINGEGGVDTVVMSGSVSNYTPVDNGGVYTVTSKLGAGSVVLTNIDYVQFSDKTVYIGPALTTTSHALTTAALVDGLYIAIDGKAPGYTAANTAAQGLANGSLTLTGLANQLLTQAGLTDVTAGTKAIFANLGLSVNGDSGPATDVANNQKGLFDAIIYLVQNDAGFKAAGGLGFVTQWLVNAMGSIDHTNNSYAAYSAASATLDTNIINAHDFSSHSANVNPTAMSTVSVGITGVLTLPLNE